MQSREELRRSSNRALRDYLHKVNQGRLQFDCPEPELPFEWARNYTADSDYALDLGRFAPADASAHLLGLFRREFGVSLDLSLASLLEVDEKLYNTGLFRHFVLNIKRETPFDYDRIFAYAVWLGAFLGECLVKSLRLTWKIRRNVFESSLVRGDIELFPLIRAARILSVKRPVSPIECSLSQFFWFASQSQDVFADADVPRLKESLKQIYSPYERRKEHFGPHALRCIGELTDECLLTTDSSGIFIWNLSGTLADHIPYQEHGEATCWVDRGETIASINMYGDLWFWGANTKALRSRSERSSTPTSTLCKLSARTLAWGCKNGKLFSWNADANALTEFGKVPAAATGIAAVGDRLAVTNGTKNIYLFDVNSSGKAPPVAPITISAIHKKQVNAVAGSHKYRIFCSAGKDRRVVIWRSDQSQVCAIDCAAVPMVAQLSEARYMVGILDEVYQIKLIDLNSQLVTFDENLRDLGISARLTDRLESFRANCRFSPSFAHAVISFYDRADRLIGALIVELEKKKILVCTDRLNDRPPILTQVSEQNHSLERHEPPKQQDIQTDPPENREVEEKMRRRWLKTQSRSDITLRKVIVGNYGQGRTPKFKLDASDFHWLILELRKEDALGRVQIVLENLSKEDLKEHLKRSAYSEGIHAELYLSDVLARSYVVNKIEDSTWSEIESSAANSTMVSIVRKLRG